MSNYDAWKTACPPEGRTLEVTLKVVVRITVSNDPDLDIDAEAAKIAGSIEGDAGELRDVDAEIDATVIEREIKS